MIQLNAAGSPDFAKHVDRIADVWARSSLAMAGVARQIGAGYLHILEPNQYLGRKPISPATNAFVEPLHRGDVLRQQKRTERDHPEAEDRQESQQAAQNEQDTKQNPQRLGDAPKQPVVAPHVGA